MKLRSMFELPQNIIGFTSCSVIYEGCPKIIANIKKSRVLSRKFVKWTVIQTSYGRRSQNTTNIFTCEKDKMLTWPAQLWTCFMTSLVKCDENSEFSNLDVLRGDSTMWLKWVPTTYVFHRKFRNYPWIITKYPPYLFHSKCVHLLLKRKILRAWRLIFLSFMLQAHNSTNSFKYALYIAVALLD